MDVFGYLENDRRNEVSAESGKEKSTGNAVSREILPEILSPIQVSEYAPRHSP
jgi:hypothetical protein